ncbi:transmembrane protein, putative, partial [Bodo saltans]
MSTVEQRMNLVSRAQALKWSMDKICRTMGLAGGGTLALIRFEKGSSRDLETKYQLLLKTVDAAAGGPIPAAGNANAAVVNVLPSVANNAPDDDNDGGVEGLLWDKVELLYEERHNAEKRKKMLLLRDQILPIATYTGSIVVVITQFM